MEDLNEASRVVARPIKAFKKVNAIKVSLLVAIKRRSDWQRWRQTSINILEKYINEGRACDLLKEPPMEGMIVSRHIAELTMKKAISLQLILRLIYIRDSECDDTISSNTYASELAAKAGRFLGVSKSFVY